MQAFRASILSFVADPNQCDEPKQAYRYFEDGLLVVDEQGIIQGCGEFQQLKSQFQLAQPIQDYRGKLICSGFIDCHIHYPQTDMIASYGEQLLAWLNEYTFVEEAKFSDAEHCKQVAEFFLNELINSGTTTALVFGTVHPQSVDAFFDVASKSDLRMICGKVLMDQNCPENLQDTAELGYQQSKQLIEKWHNKGRLQYAVTPRFAPCCSKQQLDKAGQLLTEYPDLYLHTHICENQDEVSWVQQLFPTSTGYLDVYQQSGLLTKRSVMAHGIHLTDDEFKILHQHECAIAFCPTSNLFLGSGCFPLAKATAEKVEVGLGTDIGAGTSFSMLKTLNEAYKTQQLIGNKLSPLQAFYLATLGGAKALDLDDKIGSLDVGKEADFIVIDGGATPLSKRRLSFCHSLEEQLFVLSMLADERHIAATYIKGKQWQSKND